MRHALTIDVEDYFHVSALASAISPDDWDRHDRGRVVDSTMRLLQLFEIHQHKATFFVLGWVAERYPELVRAIAESGHEVASHGYSHQLVYKQSQSVFREETAKSKKILEDIIGSPVYGYRAASYSITPKSTWALDILCDLGFQYDSSIFPVRHDRYGMPDANPYPHILKAPNGGLLAEFSLTSLKLFGYRLPIAGGGYFRLFPYWFSQWCLERFTAETKRPFVFYLHPWEIDILQPHVEKISWKSKFRHYNNLEKCEGRLEKLLGRFQFADMKSVLQSQHLLSSNGMVNKDLVESV